MRIISKYHDFYDGVGANDLDRSVIYNREHREITIPYTEKRDYNKLSDDSKIDEYDINLVYIGFCGQIIPVLRMFRWDYRESMRIDHICYSQQDAINVSEYADRGRVRDFFETQKNFPDHFQQYKCPVWLIARKKHDTSALEINPCLKSWEFYRKFDSYQCYQEISMYVGGVLGNANPPIPHIDDTTLAECKGFDKFSFRKDKKK